MRMDHSIVQSFNVALLTKFLILLIQNRDFEILALTWEMWALNDKYSSIMTPRSLKLDSGPSL